VTTKNNGVLFDLDMPDGPPPETQAGLAAFTEELKQELATTGGDCMTRQPVETVEAILAAHQDGDPLNRIAAAVGVQYSAVRRILDAADTNRQRDLVAAV